MATTLVPGPVSWGMERDEQGHRTYTVRFRVNSDTGKDGPAAVLQTAGLPVVGTFWLFTGQLNDVDIWAWCRPNAKVTGEQPREGNKVKQWVVECTFSTKPTTTDRSAGDNYEDPLLEPMKVSGSRVKYTEEATYDRFGRPILNSAWEQIRGPQNEWDANRSQVKIEQNWPALEEEIVASMVDTVNAYPLWGYPPRCVKLSDFTWEKKFHGPYEVYYQRSFTFDRRTDTFDRDIADEGTKALNGHWHETNGTWVLDNINGRKPDPRNPSHFVRFVDRPGNVTKAILDGGGMPYNPEAPPADVTTCSQCPDGAYAQMKAYGLPGDPIMVNGGGCSWSGGGAVFSFGTTWTLTYGGVTYSYDGDADEVNCKGCVVLDKMTLGSTLPSKVTVCPYNPNAGQRPGHFLVQKYDESDFTVLGIPLVL